MRTLLTQPPLVGSTNLGTTPTIITDPVTNTPLPQEAAEGDLSHVPAQIAGFETKVKEMEEKEEDTHKYRQQGLREVFLHLWF